MAQDNLDVVRRFLDTARDVPSALKLLHPDLEFIPLRAGTEGAYRGHDGYARFVADTLAAFDEFEWAYELAPLPDGRVLAWGTLHVRGRGSGAEIDVSTGGIFEFREGRISRWQDYGSKRIALEAA